MPVSGKKIEVAYCLSHRAMEFCVSFPSRVGVLFNETADIINIDKKTLTQCVMYLCNIDKHMYLINQDEINYILQRSG